MTDIELQVKRVALFHEKPTRMEIDWPETGPRELAVMGERGAVRDGIARPPKDITKEENEER